MPAVVFALLVSAALALGVASTGRAFATSPGEQGGSTPYASGEVGVVSAPRTEAAAFAVSFEANGGRGTMPAQAIACGKVVALSANKFTRSGYKFAGWNTKADGKGKSYKNKAKVKNLATAGKTVKLYAQWKKVASYTIKTGKYSFTIPKSWRGKVVARKVLGYDGFPCVGVYLKGHLGDASYLLASVSAPTGWGDGWSFIQGYRNSSGNGFCIIVPNLPYRIWLSKNSSYTSYAIASSTKDLNVMLDLLTDGKVSYSSALKHSDSSFGSKVTSAHVKAIMKNAVKSTEYKKSDF